LVVVNGTTTVATLQLTGSYTGDTFNVTSDGNKGSNITVTLAPALFTQEMAAFGGGGASGASLDLSVQHPTQTRLVYSRPY